MLYYFHICPDVTLPSCLDGSPRSRETDKEMDRARQLSHFCSSSSSGIGKVFEELMTIYDQLRVNGVLINKYFASNPRFRFESCFTVMLDKLLRNLRNWNCVFHNNCYGLLS